MPKYTKGDNAHIDEINKLVHQVKEGAEESNVALSRLIDIFKPMMLSTCAKWSRYFDDGTHKIISHSEIMADVLYWFYQYIMKYNEDGKAVFNKFIKDHIDARIRYIYESTIKYYGKYVFPDPYLPEQTADDTFDMVLQKYAPSLLYEDIEDVDAEIAKMFKSRSQLAERIILLLNNNYFLDKERDIFIRVVCHGETHDMIANKYNVSRTRITQILRKVKRKLAVLIDDDQLCWDLIGMANITITKEW
jgi:Mor family transcriptional regulator